MQESSLDRRHWETEWAALEPLVIDSPAEALPELDRLVGRMLVTEEGIDPEVLAGYRAGHDLATRADRGDDIDPAEIGQAVGLYRELYEHLVARGSPEL